MGERRLIDFLARLPRYDAASVVADLTDLIATFAPAPADDIALLALTALTTDIGGGP